MNYVISALGYGYLASTVNGKPVWSMSPDKAVRFKDPRAALRQCRQKGMPRHCGYTPDNNLRQLG